MQVTMPVSRTEGTNSQNKNCNWHTQHQVAESRLALNCNCLPLANCPSWTIPNGFQLAWKQSFPWDNYDDEFGTNRECVEAFLKWKNAELPQWREDVDLHGFDEDERTPWIAWDEMKLAEERKWREIESKLLHHIIYFPTQLQLTLRGFDDLANNRAQEGPI